MSKTLDVPPLVDSENPCWSDNFLDAVYHCLVRYWINQGIPRSRAETAARKALVKLQTNTTTETWCLVPEE
jgi:hypothetical protein